MRKLRYVPEKKTLVEVTDRTIHGRYLLLPTPLLKKTVLGALGRAQRLHGVRIFGFASRTAARKASSSVSRTGQEPTVSTRS